MDRNRRFADKVVVVSGAGAGIGAASAKFLAQEGARVLAVDIDESAARQTASDIGSAATWVAADVSSSADVRRSMDVAVEAFGKIDLYHLNAGIVGSLGALPTLSDDDFDRVLAVNLRGMFLGLRAAFGQFAAQNSTGNVVLTASIASLRGSADMLPYHVSKHGVLGLVRGAAMYGGPLGIRVNAVAPGIVPTGLFAADPDTPGGMNDMERRASTSPLRRAGTTAEIANAVAFLLSDESSYVTGHVLSVDGGASIVSSVRPSGGAGAWDHSSYDATLYGDRGQP